MSLITLRKGSLEDLEKGLWPLMNTFGSKDYTVLDSNLEAQKTIFHQASPPHIYLLVAEVKGKVVGMGRLMMEPKLHHLGKKVGHLEDIAVDPAFRGKGIGSMIVDHLTDLAKERCAYKVILGSSNEKVGFYEKLGFKSLGHQMAIYF